MMAEEDTAIVVGPMLQRSRMIVSVGGLKFINLKKIAGALES
jgi:hypothetical protein